MNKKLKISYITNTHLKEISGGGSGVNSATYTELKKRYNIQDYRVIVPKEDFVSKIFSKIKRLIGLQGNYQLYSDHRLNVIAETFENHGSTNSDLFFFHGFTPWIKTVPNKPYYCFNDACFATYVEIYNRKEDFSPIDLKRIYDLEAKWLTAANGVFFRSKWALEETKKHYNLVGQNFYVAGLGGFIPIPEKDNYKAGFNFLFLSREFLPKGGDVAVKAMEIVSMEFPEAKLWIVGDKPPEYYISAENIIYKGYFDKAKVEDSKKLKSLMSQSFALVHPTLKDTNSLVITEVAYFGCPAISSNFFAIPEYLLNERTGYLLDNPRDAESLAEKMKIMIRDNKKYLMMRKEARNNAINNNTWQNVGERFYEVISKTIG